MKMKIILPVISLGMFIFAVASVVGSKPSISLLPPPEAPASSSFAHTVAAVGLVEASTENIAIGAPVPGLVTAVHVAAGSRVRAGERLFSLDDRDLQAELVVATKSLELSMDRLARLEALPRPEDVPPAEARVREAESALNDAKVQLALMESVTDKRAIREEELSRRRFAVQAAKARLEEAQARLALLKAGSWRHDLGVARAEVGMAEAQVSRIKTDIERLTVRAPVSGIILQSNVRVGEYAQTGPLGRPLMLVGSVGSLHVRVDVDENDAWRVRAGAPAEASVRGNASLRGPLRFVRFEPYVIPKESLSGSGTERVDTRVLQVIYRLEPDALPVYVGQQVDVFIEAPGLVKDGGMGGAGSKEPQAPRGGRQ